VSEMLEFDIHAIAAGGDGVGRAEGLVVFAPRTVPGDRVRANVERGKRFARATRVELVRSSSSRVAPPCPHFVRDACGGCQLQQMSDASQRDAKAGIVRDAFQRIAKREIRPPEIRHAESPWRYRTKLTLALRRTGEEWIAGLHRFDAPAEVFALHDCLITDERVMDVWTAVLDHGRLLPPARELRASIRLLDAGAALVVEGGTEWSEAPRLLAAVAVLDAIWWIPEGEPRRRVAARDGFDRHGASFIQVNAGIAALMRDHVLALARAATPRRVIDGYSGIGDTAVPLAEGGARVVAIELDREASRVCATRLPHGSHAVADAVEHVLPGALPADLVLLNPPRDGVDARVTRALEGATPRPQSIIYSSCDPATLARDVGRLPSYRVASVVGFDMFPQTAHIEVVCELVSAA
jgi:23S rRNA (uracil1939-C5)-methyltransferase